MKIKLSNKLFSVVNIKPLNTQWIAIEFFKLRIKSWSIEKERLHLNWKMKQF